MSGADKAKLDDLVVLELAAVPTDSGQVITVSFVFDGEPVTMALTRGDNLEIDGKRAWSGIDDETDSVHWDEANSEWVIYNWATGEGYTSATD